MYSRNIKDKNNIILILFLIINFTINLKIKSNSKKGFDIQLKRREINNEKHYNNLINLKTSLIKKYYSDLNLHKELQSFYTGYIYIGSTPQIIPVVFDTGSGYNWIASKYCHDNNQCPQVENYYNNTESHSYKNLNEKLKIKFGKGELTGSMSKDVIALNSQIILLDEIIGEIETVNGDFLNGISGIIGLGYNSLNLYNHTLFDGLIESKLLNRNVISFYFNEEVGQINFGYIDANKYRGILNSHNVIDKSYWTIRMNDIKINEISLNICNISCNVIIDTGTNVILMTPDLYEIIIDKININSDCQNLENLSKIILNLDDIEYTISPYDYVYKFLDKSTMKKKCELNILPLQLPNFTDKTIILGESFIKNYYTVFDRDSDQVHFALKK